MSSKKTSYEISMNGNKNDGFIQDEINGKYKSTENSIFKTENGIETVEKLPEKKEKSDKEESEKKKNPTMVSLFSLFRFAEPLDWVFMLIGTLGSMASGASFPVMMLVFTSIIDTFSGYGSSLCQLQASLSANSTAGALPTSVSLGENLRSQIIWMIVLAIIQMFVSYFQVTFWLMPAERQIKRMRSTLFKSILRQDIGWYDTYKSGELTSRMTEDINKVKEGISDKFGSMIQYISTFISGVVIGFVKGWKLTLVILSLSPVLFIAAVLFTKLAGYLTSSELKSYAKAGAVAEEVFTAIRTVFAFNGAQKEHKRYEEKLEDARKFGIRKSVINGILMGFIWIVINGAYALGFWYGWTLTTTPGEDYSVGKILLVFFSIIIAVFSLGNAAPFITTITTARAAAYEVFQIIDRESKIDPESENGLKPNQLVGQIQFSNIDFKYPARPEVQILSNFNLTVKPGQTVALVGKSGCGKSTCIQLLQRFYDPIVGSVAVDGNNIKDLNLNWIRTHIGVVNQEPILFSSSIAENIRMGRDGVTQEEIEQAAMSANAHDFIMTLPDKYNTLVGNRGGQLSGGQKQRIAIARALVRNPKILLLDEATSALDNESESIVQAALDRARLGRTTIIVAHRLSTIRNADLIFAMKDGKVLETGTHDQLMALNGLYHSLVITQAAGIEEKKKSKPTEVQESSTKLKEKKVVEEVDPAKKKEIEKKEKTKEPSMLRVFALNKPEWYIIVIGCVASILSGAVQPAFSIVFSKVLAVFSKCDIEEQRRDIVIYCILFICFGIVTFLSNLLQNSMFGISGENLTKRLRSRGFKAMLSQDIGWFDDPANNVGALSTRLSTEAAAVQGATGVRIGQVLMNVGNFGVGLILAFVYGWAITLVILAFVPFLIISGILQTKMLTGFSSKDKLVLEEAGEITNQAISNIRTVANLTKEKYFYDEYRKKLDAPYKAAMRSANLYGAMFGFTNSITFFATAAAFSLGGYLIDNKLFGMTFENVMLVFSCIIFGAQSVGQASSLAPDYAKSKAAIAKMFELFDRKPPINNWESESKEKIKESDFDPTIVMDSLEFRYPTRPDAPVLQKLSLTVKKGQRVALVGSSGCGKSTVTQLLERFYDSHSGSIKISGLDTKNADLFWLRSQMGIVSQEPILFDGTIAENIAYGDNSREVPINEIIEAAKQANIHNFIISLPDGYETNVGSKGTQLSGGQKQRIAIARALVRNPKILLLDEATSALDTESEKIVQEALDRAQQGRTCIIIAHRLTTIKNADVIYVIKDGKVLEHGNHNELINQNGFYSKLYNSH